MTSLKTREDFPATNLGELFSSPKPPEVLPENPPKRRKGERPEGKEGPGKE